jgi:hypothetical protein
MSRSTASHPTAHCPTPSLHHCQCGNGAARQHPLPCCSCCLCLTAPLSHCSHCPIRSATHLPLGSLPSASLCTSAVQCLTASFSHCITVSLLHYLTVLPASAVERVQKDPNALFSFDFNPLLQIVNTVPRFPRNSFEKWKVTTCLQISLRVSCISGKCVDQ